MPRLLTPPPCINFRRELIGPELADWDRLLTLLADARLSESADLISWRLASSGKFSVKSMYRELCHGQIPAAATGLWKAKIPLKIKVFLWQLCQDRLPTSINLAKRNGPASGPCALCGVPEDADHTFFLCSLARFAWSAVREAAGVDWDPRSRPELVSSLSGFQGASRRVMWTCAAAMLWAIWNTRNKFTIEGVFPSHPADVIFKCIVFLQQWASLGRQQDSDLHRQAICRLHAVYSEARAPSPAQLVAA